jgi:hypothetical protein
MKAAAACALLAAFSLSGAQDPPRQRFRSTSELVAVDVLVMDGRRVVTGLLTGNPGSAQKHPRRISGHIFSRPSTVTSLYRAARIVSKTVIGG